MSELKKAIALEELKAMAARTKQETATAVQEATQAISVPVYNLEKQETAESGYLSTYYLTKDGEAVGAKINIPKDFLVKDADIKTVDTADQPYEGAAVGDKYIDFTVNSVEGDAQESHIYLAVNELVDVYTAGDGIDISDANAVSVKVDSDNANGLEVTSAGVKLNLATATTAGAMSAEDKDKLDGITFATSAEVTAMLDEVYGTTSE